MFARVLSALAVAVAAGFFAAAPARRPQPEVVRGEERRFLVRLDAVVANAGSEALRGVECVALLPLELPRQQVRWMRLSGHGWTVRTDSHQNTVATSAARDVAPGDAVTFSWIASIDLAAEHHSPSPEAERALPPAVRRYLDDDRRLGLGSAAVRDAAAAVEGATPYARANSAAELVRRRVHPVLEGGWDSAPRVLERGSGSCSESVFAFIAICRRLGVPARWTGGTMLRGGPSGRACDETFHRIAEVWLPGHGWHPVETQAPADGRLPAGPLPRAFLQLARGDASGDAPAGDRYHARLSWQGPAAAPRTWIRAWWIAGVDDDAAVGDDAACAEIVACDALGFGPVLDAAGAQLAPAPSSRPTPGDAADLLVSAWNPEGLRLAALALREDAAALRAVAARCVEPLAAEFLRAAAGTPAEVETWWARCASRVECADDGRYRLTRAP